MSCMPPSSLRGKNKGTAQPENETVAAESDGKVETNGGEAVEGASGNALVLSGPERRHHKVRRESRNHGGDGEVETKQNWKQSGIEDAYRYGLQVYVVELSRKPLFPGIYTPVMVSKNEKLIKEILETKKQG